MSMKVKPYAKRVLSMVAAAVLTLTSLTVFTPSKAEQEAAVPQYAFMDTSLTFEERAADLVSRLTLDEKVNQLGRTTVAVPRLGLAGYDYWNEALHGIQNGTGEGTSFPMPLSMAQTWDEEFIREVANAISDETRGHNQPLALGGRGRGLTYWCPTINLARSPLWGRTNEAYGEDAYVSGMLSSAFVEGMMGDDEDYLKSVPTIKHYALNNNENDRDKTSSNASEADIRDYYTRVYRYVIERTNVPSLMAAYNAVNYTPSASNTFLLTTLLRKTFGFTGFVVSDCGAINNIKEKQKWVPTKNTVQVDNYTLMEGKTLSDYVDSTGMVTKAGSIAMALMAGCDMDCGGQYYPPYAMEAYKAGILSEDQIDINVYNNLLARFKVGEFDPEEMVKYRSDAYSFVNTVENDEHRALADEAATKSIVLLKNQDNFLPLSVEELDGKSIVMVGDNIDKVLLGNYHGKPKAKNQISVYAGVSDYLFNHRAEGDVQLSKVETFGENGEISAEDKDLIAAADVVIMQTTDEHADSSEGADRDAMILTRNQNEIIKQVIDLNDNVVLYMQTANVVEIKDFKDGAKAILWGNEGGQSQGVGAANQLFGETNPSGKLTFTWYAEEDEVPGLYQYGLSEAFGEDALGQANQGAYTNGGFTYQYFEGEVEYPFGYGLSYTTYEYSNAAIDKTSVDANGEVTVTVDVKNTGSVAGSEVVQAYVVYPNAEANGLPKKQIKGFAKVDLEPGQTKTATIKIDVADCRFWNEDLGKNVVPTGKYTVQIGASSEDIKATKDLTVSGTLADEINLLTVTPSGVAMDAGETLTSDVTIAMKDDSFLDNSKATITYESDNEAVATVNNNGVVTGVAAGVATITVTATYNGSSDTYEFPVAVRATVKATGIKVNGANVNGFVADVTAYNVEVANGQVPTVSATAASGVNVDVQQASAVPGKATITLTKGSEKTVYVVNFVDKCNITAIDFPSVTLTTAQAASYTLNAKATIATCDQSGHANKEVTYAYEILDDGITTLDAQLEGNVLKSTGLGRVTVQVTATYNGSKMVKTAQIHVSNKADYSLLEEAVRVMRFGSDIDPEKLAEFYAQRDLARAVLYNENATQEEIDQAYTDLMAIKTQLADRTYTVATFARGNKEYKPTSTKMIHTGWAWGSVNKDDGDDKIKLFDLTTHDPTKLELRFTITLTPTDSSKPFSDVVMKSASWIKLRSADEGNRNSDPDLSQYGGNGDKKDSNVEHNFGWAVSDYVQNWGTTEVVIPLADENGQLPVVNIETGKADKWNKAQKHTSLGSISWSDIDRFQVLIAFIDEYKNAGNSATAVLDNIRIVDISLEEEREELTAILDQKVAVEDCDDAELVTAYNDARVKAQELLDTQSESTNTVISAKKALIAAIDALGVDVTTNKDALKAALDAQVTDLERYTEESIAAYRAKIQEALELYIDEAATQIDINRTIADLENADSILQTLKSDMRVVHTILEGEQSSEAHALEVTYKPNLDMSAEKGYSVTVRYDIKIESTHPTAPLSNDWLKWVRNGHAKFWTLESGQNNDNMETIYYPMSCEKDSILTSYTEPGTWKTITQDVPASVMEAGKLTQFQIRLYNDTHNYLGVEDDGIDWNRDTGVKMTVRNIEILSDRPENFEQTPVDTNGLDLVIQSAQEKAEDDYTADSWAAMQEALTAAVAVKANTNATQDQIKEATLVLADALAGLIRNEPVPPVPSINYGDVNGEDGITAEDALLTLQAATNKIALTEDRAKVANVDGEGTVTANDALMILQHATKKISIFPVEKQA